MVGYKTIIKNKGTNDVPEGLSGTRWSDLKIT